MYSVTRNAFESLGKQTLQLFRCHARTWSPMLQAAKVSSSEDPPARHLKQQDIPQTGPLLLRPLSEGQQEHHVERDALRTGPTHVTAFSECELEQDHPKEDGAQTEPSPTNAEETSTVGPTEEFLNSLGPELRRKAEILGLELEGLYQMGRAVPKRMSESYWKEALQLETRAERLKLYRFLCVRDSHREREKAEKAERRKQLEKLYESTENQQLRSREDYMMEYGLNKNTVFFRVYERTMNNVYNHWQCQGILFGQSIVFDLSYDDFMRKHECENCADQLKNTYAFNKRNRQPFHLHLCNARSDSPTLSFLQKFVPNLYTNSCLMTVTEKSYLDLFPREKIVYLTPDAKEELETYDHEAVYVVGAVIEKSIQKPVSMAKAKKEGLKMARLPLDSVLRWGFGGRGLTLDQTLKIMLDVKNTNDWNLALRHVTRRKLNRSDDENPDSSANGSRKFHR